MNCPPGIAATLHPAGARQLAHMPVALIPRDEGAVYSSCAHAHGEKERVRAVRRKTPQRQAAEQGTEETGGGRREEGEGLP